MDNKVAANVLGTIGAVCWSVQVSSRDTYWVDDRIDVATKLIPQIIVNYRRHNATGVQPAMMMLWAWAGISLGVYNIVRNFNIALQVQPQILTFLSLVTWSQCYYYKKKWSILRALALIVPTAALMGGVEAALIISVRLARDRHADWPLTLMAVLSALLLALGVLRHYWDVWVHHKVRGLSFIFVAIDAAGDLFSLLSLLFEPKIDILGLVVYSTELILWIGIFICGIVFNLMPWLRVKWRKGDVAIPPVSSVDDVDI